MKPTEALNAIICTDTFSSVVCQEKPVGVTEPAIFLVNTEKLQHINDLKADDMGTWTHKGKPIRYFKVERCAESGIILNAQLCDDVKSTDTYKLTRIYYHHGATPQFRKTIFYVHGNLQCNSYYTLCTLLYT